MPLFTDQDRLVVRPGESIAATIYAENDSDRGGMFTLDLEPTDPNLRHDWYTADIQPRALAISPGATEKFEVRITAKRSPHGSARLIEFNLRAAQAGVGAGGGVPSGSVPPRGPQPTPGGLADAFAQAFQGGRSAPATGEVNLDELAMGGSATVPEPQLFAASPPPEVNLFQAAAPTTSRQSRVITLGNHDDAYVTIDEIPAANSGNGAAEQPVSANPNDPAAASGSVRGVMIGSLYLYVPPIPEFAVEIYPYQPDNKKKKAPDQGEKNPVVSGREKGALTVRVLNKDQFPASFRLVSSGDDGSQYHLREQWLRVDPNSAEETVISVKPHDLNWWRWVRPYGFEVVTTPLTGSMKIDQTVALERPGAFRQTLAWLHPVPLLGLAALLLLPFLAGKPQIVQFEIPTRTVFRASYDLDDAETAGYVFNRKAALAALEGFGEQSRATVDFEVRGARSVQLEYLCESWPEQKWRTIDLDRQAIQQHKTTQLLDPGTEEKDANFKFRLRATGIFPWAVSHSQSTKDCKLLINPRARIAFNGRVPQPGSATLEARKSGGYAVIDIKNDNADTDAEHNYLFLNTVPNSRSFHRALPNAELTLAPQGGDTWKYTLPDDHQPGVVTVISNAKNGRVWQYRVPAGP